MRALVMADLDEGKWPFGAWAVDLIIACGDLYDQAILGAAEACCCRTVLAVRGNHDLPQPFPAPIRDLHGRVAEVLGLRFGGFNGSWKYKRKGHFLYDQDEAACALAALPPVDVLVTHNSPYGIHQRDADIHQGFLGLNQYVERVRPRLLIHGHQHLNRETLVGPTRVVGVFGWRVLEL